MVTRIERKLTETTEKRIQYQNQIHHISKRIVAMEKQIAKNNEEIEKLQRKAKRLH